MLPGRWDRVEGTCQQEGVDGGEGGEVMKIKLNENGRLFINDKMKMCPFVPHGVITENTPRDYVCGDWCALFTENTPRDYVCGDWCALFKDSIGSSDVLIHLCHDTDWICSMKDFTDERPKP